MFEREALELIEWWPFTLPFILSQAIILCYYRYNQALSQQGVWIYTLYHGGAVMWIVLVLILLHPLFSGAFFIYLTFLFGWSILFIVLAILAFSFIGFFVFGLLPFGQYILPLASYFFLISQAVLFDVFYLSWIAHFNIWFFSFF